MSWYSRLIARFHGQRLPTYASVEEARRELTRIKDGVLADFLAEYSESLGLDHSIESLKRVEHWFLTAGSPARGRTGYSTTAALGYYFAAVLCESAGFHWTVQEFVFAPGRYEIGVEKDLAGIMVTGGWQFPKAGNARKQSMWRMARQLAG